jgi:4-amino-4-deoxy-L-arabinose transferase-like glycosyltransferase
MLFPQRRERILYCTALVVALTGGVFLRLPQAIFANGSPLHALASLHPAAKFSGIGFDEGLYREYVNTVARTGLSGYPDIVEQYISLQKKLPASILPPVRFLYIFTAYAWHSVFGTEALEALHNVAAFFSVLTLVLATVFAWRLRGPIWALGTAALMAVAPTQIHMSQHALVDGFFAFWALLSLWLLWENLQAPSRTGWLVSYGLALSLLVLTKENAFFVYVAIVVILLCNRWLQFGAVTRALVLTTIVGPLLGVVILVFLAGSLLDLVSTYQLSVSKNYQLAYAIITGDGPWYRYLIDLLLVSPIVLILAIGGVFRLDRTQKSELFLSAFVVSSYLIMCNIKYGMNLRYANMWDMPLRFVAFGQITYLFAPLRRYRVVLMCLAVGLFCAFELRQYIVLFVRYPLYELVSEGLLRALKILKSH